MEALRKWVEEGWWVNMGFEFKGGIQIYWCEIADGNLIKEGKGKTLNEAITKAIGEGTS